MNVQSPTSQSIRSSFLGFYEKNRLFFRIVGKLAFWAMIWLFERYYFSPRLYRDNSDVIIAGSTITFLQTIVLYYLLGYLILPRFLYTRRYALFLVVIFSIFFLMYQINYKAFDYLLSISNVNNDSNNEIYVSKIVKMLQGVGWLGCFINLRVFFWNYAYSFFFVTLILAIKTIKDIVGYQRKLVAIERDKFALELDILKAQVNPHFLFNTLNSVYSRIFDTDEKAADLILRLSELMRYNLYETNLPKIALDKELAYIQNYLDLERNRLSDRYVVIEYEQSGNPSTYQITPLLLIAFVENAFKHGVKGTTEPAYVQVKVNLTERQLVFQVENSMPDKRLISESNKKSGGVGLGNVRRRLDTLYEDKYELVVTQTENTYEVTLIIQVEILH